MKVIMFKNRFARLVEAGTKQQTVRPQRKKPVKAGDKLSLREWTGLPYRSKQRELCRAYCSSVIPVTISKTEMRLDGNLAEPDFMQTFAEADGFESYYAMWLWFWHEHGIMEFKGDVIEWVTV